MSKRLAYTFKRATVQARRDRDHQRLSLTLEDLLRLHGEASAAVMLMLLALLCVVPIAGIGTVLSLVILALAWRWHRDPHHCAIPQRIRQVPMNETWSHRCLGLLAWMYSRAERLLRARWQWLYHQRLLPWWGAWIGLMALIIMMPIPFGNVLPGASLMLMSLAWMFRDGLLLLCSTVLGAGAIGLALAMGQALLFSAEQLMRWAA